MINTTMRVSYDRAADALAIELDPGTARARSHKLEPGVILHYDQNNRLIELEILAASRRYPVTELEQVGTPVEYLTLAEAAKEADLSPATLRVQIHNGRLEARKRGHDWLVSRAALWTYLENRAPQGRRRATKRGKRQRATRGKASRRRATLPAPSEDVPAP